jgi:hypothetical protein
LVFEILSTPASLVYLVSLPPQVDRSVKSSLRGALPALGLEPVPAYRADWTFAVELRPVELTKPNSNLVGALLTSFRHLREGDAVLAQFIFHPSGHRPEGSDERAFYVAGRIAARGPEARAKELLQDVLSKYQTMEAFSTGLLEDVEAVNHRATPRLWASLMSPKTLAIVCGLPIGGPRIEGLQLGGGRKLPPDNIIPSQGGLPIAMANYPGMERPLNLSAEDLAKHMDVVGRTGVGKSIFMGSLAVEQIKQGYGVGVIDPHGDLIEWLLRRIPDNRRDDVILFEPGRTDHAVGLNIFAGVQSPEVVADQMMAIFKGIYNDQGIYTSNYLRGAIQAVAGVPAMTLVDVPVFLRDARFRARILRQVEDATIRDLWRRFEADNNETQKAAMTLPALNRIQPLLMRSSVRLTLGQSENRLDMARVLRERKVLLVSLPANQEETATLSGSLFFSGLWSAATSVPQDERQLYFLHLDEAQRFMNMPQALDTVLEQARKFKLGLDLAHPGVARLSMQMRAAINASTRTKVVFQSGMDDARELAKELGVEPADIASLNKREVIIKTVVDDRTSNPVTGKTRQEVRPTSDPAEVRRLNDERWARSAREIDEEIMRRQQAAGTGGPPRIGRVDDDA